MAAKVGDRVPDVQVMTMGPNGPQPVQTGDVLGRGRVVLFAVPGAFTPTCSDEHLPGFVVSSDELKAKGVDVIVCIAVNDVFVMDAWGKARGVGDSIVMLADGNGDFAKQMGLELDGRSFGMGTRSQRYAAIIEDGVIKLLNVEPGSGVTVSSADTILNAL